MCFAHRPFYGWLNRFAASLSIKLHQIRLPVTTLCRLKGSELCIKEDMVQTHVYYVVILNVAFRLQLACQFKQTIFFLHIWQATKSGTVGSSPLNATSSSGRTSTSVDLKLCCTAVIGWKTALSLRDLGTPLKAMPLASRLEPHMGF